MPADAPNRDPENRQFTRVRLPFQVRLIHDGGVLEVPEGVDVSAGGLAIESTESLPVGTLCRFEIELSPSILIRGNGRVARVHDTGLAVAIEELDYDGFELLKNLVRFNADDPRKVDEEFTRHLGLKAR